MKEQIHRWITEDRGGTSEDTRCFANSLFPPSTCNWAKTQEKREGRPAMFSPFPPFLSCYFCWNLWLFGFHLSDRFPIILCPPPPFPNPGTALVCTVLFLNSSTGACLCVNDLFRSCLLFWINFFFNLLSYSWREIFFFFDLVGSAITFGFFSILPLKSSPETCKVYAVSAPMFFGVKTKKVLSERQLFGPNVCHLKRLTGGLKVQ